MRKKRKNRREVSRRDSRIEKLRMKEGNEIRVVNRKGRENIMKLNNKLNTKSKKLKKKLRRTRAKKSN